MRWYEQIAAPTGIHNLLWTTARIVAVTSVVALLLGYVVALARCMQVSARALRDLNDDESLPSPQFRLIQVWGRG